MPHSPEWLAFWDQQAYNHAVGKDSPLFPLEAMRAVLQYTDDPASLFGQLCRESEANYDASVVHLGFRPKRTLEAEPTID